MERTNTALAAMTALALRLVTEHIEAPALSSVDVGFGFHPVTRVHMPRIQLYVWAPAPDRSIQGVAEWARRLAGTVNFDVSDTFTHIAGWVEINGVLVEAWDHIRPGELTEVLPTELADRAQAGQSIPPAELLSALA